MSALLDIQQTLYRLALGFDEADLDLFADCFTEDAVVDTVGGDHLEGRAAIREHFSLRRDGRREREEQSRHVVTNTLVLEEGESDALVVSYLLGITTVGGETRVQGAWYRDRFVIDDGRWRIRWHYIYSDAAGVKQSPLDAALEPAPRTRVNAPPNA